MSDFKTTGGGSIKTQNNIKSTVSIPTGGTNLYGRSL